MSLPLAVVICLSAIQLGMGDQPVDEVITTKKVPLLGAWTDRSLDADDIKEAAQHAVTAYNTHSKSKKMFKLISITAAKTQATNVINFKIVAILGKTNCLKGENHDLKNCKLGKKRIDCTFEMSYDPRKEKFVAFDHHCKRRVEKA